MNSLVHCGKRGVLEADMFRQGRKRDSGIHSSEYFGFPQLMGAVKAASISPQLHPNPV